MSDIPRPPEAATQASEVRLRLWPALLIVIVQLAAVLWTLFMGATNTQGMIGFIAVPVLGLLLLVIWWLAASRAPWRSRLLGLLLVIAALTGIVGTQTAWKAFILLAAIPTLTTALVVMDGDDIPAPLVSAQVGAGHDRGRLRAVLLPAPCGRAQQQSYARAFVAVGAPRRANAKNRFRERRRRDGGVARTGGTG